ncbi:hypothetical protein CLV24_1186 [Pontibacter ummariensis]|uniref:Uncharacterized protein n=1 Tax=Pontibacter ummariensis TaxID=1610492 RepID=A0A239IVI1_9BACT|nr:hypothetical protein [Pontibacter ummariensis]PRY09669.1 hypothetical protein CLV24_1186 [Pontibacter ummariensis]SNS96434.1 hypothetical protein SAMN06296052_11882 [Pontibacter ummariensis]
MKTMKIALGFLGLALFATSCENEMEEMDTRLTTSAVTQHAVVSPQDGRLNTRVTLKNLSDVKLISENLRGYFVINNAVEATDCGPTEFISVQNKYIGQLGRELVPVFGGPTANYLFNLYMNINFVSAYFDRSPNQYFGEKGEYTNFVTKRTRELEGFWNMPGQIRVNGQHNETLNDRNKVGYILYNYFSGFASEKEAYDYADILVGINATMATLPESPFFAIDGFATSGNLIVIGDGLVGMMTEAGVEQDIVWTGILAHEWAHQIQFDNTAAWYPAGAADNAPEATRYTELEADFMAAYYMTHKRGATYNWKRVEQFFNLFFQIGDCSFGSAGHHGTPAQRLAAAQLGYETANQAQKQGHILSPQQLHELFVASINNLL